LRRIKNNYGADYIAGISSARCTNEETILMQKFIRAVIGTNNIDSCARVCHSPTASECREHSEQERLPIRSKI
jgi:formate dehydrogenase major subunit